MRSAFIKLSGALLLMAFIGMWSACKTSDLIAEPAKNIEGVWKVDKIIRNNQEITERVNADAFQLTFQRDTAQGGTSGNYSIVNGAPFVVSNDGTWALNDPAYPFYLSFTPDSKGNPVQVKFYFPVVQGQNRIKLVFSPGCTSNTYEYLLKKVDN